MMEAVTGPIEESVEMTRTFPTVTERYFSKYYYIPKEKKKQETSADNGDQIGSKEEITSKENSSNYEDDQSMDTKNDKQDQMNPDDEAIEEDKTFSTSLDHDWKKGGVRSPLDSSGHTCVMMHTNKLCLVTLSHRHPIVAQKKKVTQVSYEVGKFNRLENQVSGKGKRGAQIMGPQSPVCLITCDDGVRYSIMAGVHGKLVEVNERLVSNPELVTERPDAEGYLAVVLPPLRTIDVATARLLTAPQYQLLQ